MLVLMKEQQPGKSLTVICPKLAKNGFMMKRRL